MATTNVHSAQDLIDYNNVQPEVDCESATSTATVAEPITLDCHVLVVDDRRDIRFLSNRILTSAGATVTECEDGLLALAHAAMCASAGDWPDLILLDMQMPNLDGYATAQRLRENGYSGPIVALTADAMQTDMNKCLSAGCNDYLSKPVQKERLLEKVALWTKGSSH